MQFSSWRRNRIIAFLGGAGLLSWALWSGPSPILPEWAVDVLQSVPLGLCVYGFTKQSQNVIAMVPAGTAPGVGIFALYRVFGFGLF